jgi:hypothetical protein
MNLVMLLLLLDSFFIFIYALLQTESYLLRSPELYILGV